MFITYDVICALLHGFNNRCMLADHNAMRDLHRQINYANTLAFFQTPNLNSSDSLIRPRLHKYCSKCSSVQYKNFANKNVAASHQCV